MEDQITPTCKALAGIALAATALTATPATARLRLGAEDPARAYVQARAASISGDHERAAGLLARLAEQQPNDADLARKALTEAIGAGQMDLAVRLAARIPQARLTNEGRLLLAAEELRRNRHDRALAWLGAAKLGESESIGMTFMSPLITAWGQAERNDLNGALATIEAISANSLLGPMKPEQTALILLKFRRTAEAEPFARRAIGGAGGRETRLRLALADAFMAAGDQARALAMIEGMGAESADTRQRILARRSGDQAIDTGAEAFSEALTAFAAEVARLQRQAPPIGLVQVARHAAPRNSGATLLLALLLDRAERTEAALKVLRSVPESDPLIGEARDLQVQFLNRTKRYNEAYAIAASAASARGASAADYSRLGEVFVAMDRHTEAADAYARAIAMAQAQRLRTQLWQLLLLRASALEEANRWPEAKQSLEQALQIEPDQPLLLNFLGYAKLERGEDVTAAEAMISKASNLAPEDASITDSLGWAQYKQGKVTEAVETLQRAAAKDPTQPEILEHLGDALYRSGQRFQARFAWNAALVTAEDEIAARVKAKLQAGLTPTNAAP